MDSCYQKQFCRENTIFLQELCIHAGCTGLVSILNSVFVHLFCCPWTCCITLKLSPSPDSTRRDCFCFHIGGETKLCCGLNYVPSTFLTWNPTPVQAVLTSEEQSECSQDPQPEEGCKPFAGRSTGAATVGSRLPMVRKWLFCLPCMPLTAHLNHTQQELCTGLAKWEDCGRLSCLGHIKTKVIPTTSHWGLTVFWAIFLYCLIYSSAQAQEVKVPALF